MERKLQVFVSSTYTDMRFERQAAIEAILECGHIPAGMELFAADNRSQFEVIKKWIKSCDLFILILGGRYGSKEKTTNKSYIQREYEYAKHIGKKPIAIVLSDKGIQNKIAKSDYQISEQEFLSQEYIEFKKSILKSQLISFFDDVPSLKNCIFRTLQKYENNCEYFGWIRSNAQECEEKGHKQIACSNLNDAITNAIKDRNTIQTLRVFAQSTTIIQPIIRSSIKCRINDCRLMLRSLNDPEYQKIFSNHVHALIQMWKDMVTEGKIGELSICYYDDLPSEYNIIINDDTLIIGNYILTEHDRTHITIDRVFTVNNDSTDGKEVISSYISRFEKSFLYLKRHGGESVIRNPSQLT